MPTIIERTWRVQVFTDLGRDPRIEFLRERVKRYEDGGEMHEQVGTVGRALSQIHAQAIPGGARTVRTLGEVFALVAELGHALAGEDAAALEAARVAAELAAEAAEAETDEVAVVEDEP